jgi:hypothetical protein
VPFNGPEDGPISRPGAREWLRILCKGLAWLSINLAGIVLLLLAIEGGTRLIHLHFPGLPQPGESDRGLWAYDATKGWFHVPGANGVSYLGGPDRGAIRINSLGLRGPDVALEKPDGVVRVLVFGDSFVFGVGVDEEHLFTTQLSHLLNASGTGSYEVVNMGVSGYSTDQEYLLLEERGLRLHPDVVLLVACDNDFDGNLEDFAYEMYYKPYYVQDAEGRLVLHNVPVPRLDRAQQAKVWMARHSNVWNALRSRRSQVPGVRQALRWFRVGRARRHSQDSVDLMLALVLAFHERVRSAGARFLFLNSGHRGERTPLYQALRPRLEAAGVRMLGLEGNLGAGRRNEPWRHWDFPSDTHWNVDAHHRAAVVTPAALARGSRSASAH